MDALLSKLLDIGIAGGPQAIQAVLALVIVALVWDRRALVADRRRLEQKYDALIEKYDVSVKSITTALDSLRDVLVFLQRTH